MITSKTAPTGVNQLHRNLKSLATVATTTTGLRNGAYSRCRLIKEVATGGNTNSFLNIGCLHRPLFWLLLLPVKKQRQQNMGIGSAWKARNPWLLPLLPLLPVFLKLEEHVCSCFSEVGAT
ncbi:hypothetical protein SAMN05216296_1028 [Pseudomonas pohangensis]|uniref:Uncharacterized protein n=1 Tax=Pseudomonas pohangensis TaxID=364197 RepID=A0A1H2ES21_9PSED|nr:hypothetical protein [Pseudomonas pohangensis]SDT97900.1 hypothetical protein SAMN05216296_1028 [Pseudomonas pohangensis]